MTIRVVLVFAFIFWGASGCFGQQTGAFQDKKITPFIAYEFGEAIFNKFQSLSGEIGIRFPNRHLIRLVHQNIKFTEEHLSSDFAVTVRGDNVEGELFGFEAFYSLPIKKWKNNDETLYVSPSLGYYKNDYAHTIIEQRFEKRSMTFGLELSYRGNNAFKIKGLYYTIAIPVRVHFDPHEEFKLGDTTISGNRFDNNIWFFVGYQF